MACIRACNQAHMSSACAAAPDCACRQLTGLRLIYGCVVGTCTPIDADMVEKQIIRNCGDGIAQAMVATAQRPPRVSPSGPPPTRPPVPPPTSSRRPEERTSTSRPIPIVVPTTRSSTSAAIDPVRTTSTSREDFVYDPTTDKVEERPSASSTLALPPTEQRNTTSVGVQTTEDVFGGAIDDDISSTRVPYQSEDKLRSIDSTVELVDATGAASKPMESLVSDSEQHTQSQGIHTTDSGPVALTPTGTDSSLPEADADNRTSIIAGAIGGVVGVVILVALVLLCLRNRRKKKANTLRERAGRMSCPQPPEDEPDTWAKFALESPGIEKRTLSGHDQVQADGAQEDTFQAVTYLPEGVEAMTSATATHSSGESEHRLYSHYQDVMPPPSMRSKRHSRNTLHTVKSFDAPSWQPGFDVCHTMDSQTQLSYPLDRPPSSAFSMETARPPFVAEGLTLARPGGLSNPAVIPEQPPTLQSLASGASTPSRNSSRSLVTHSRSSTRTNLSLGAVGGDDIGRAL